MHPFPIPAREGGRGIVVVVLALAASASCDCDGGNLGQLHPLIAADVGRVAFADTFVGARRSQTVRLSNPGTALLRVRALRIDGDGAFAIDATAPINIEVGNDLDVEVVFAPVVVGAVSAQLVVDSTADNQAELTVDLAGVGLAPLDCDDDNACTDERFDLDEGVCIRGFGSGACDDGSACTFNDRCDQGSCVGDAVVCEDDVDCTIDACDAARGCVFLPDNSACADDDPCSLDICGRDGCENPGAPDGTPCGRILACDAIDLCLARACVPFDIPDGSPCSDGDTCTSDDSCAGGVCVGQNPQTPPALLGESHRVLLPRDALIVGDDLLLVDQRLRVVPLAGTFAPRASLPSVAVDVTPRSVVVTQDPGEAALLYPTARGFAAVTRLPPAGAADESNRWLAFYDVVLGEAQLVSQRQVGPDYVGNTFSALTSNGIASCQPADFFDPGDPPAIVFFGREGSGSFGYNLDTTVMCSGDNHSSDGARAFDVIGTDLVVRDLEQNAAVTTTVPLPAVPGILDGWRIRGDRGFIATRSGAALLVDLANAVPEVAAFVPPTSLFSRGLVFDDIVGNVAIAHDVFGFHLVDISDINAPVIVDWFVSTGTATGLGVAAASGDQAVLRVGRDLWRVDLTTRGLVPATPLVGRGGFATLVGDGDRLLGVSSTQLSIVNTESTEAALRVDLPVGRLFVGGVMLAGRTSAARELFSPLLRDVTFDLGGLASGAIETPDEDRREPLLFVPDPNISRLSALLGDDGSFDVAFGLGLGTVPGGDAYRATVTTAFCTGAGLLSGDATCSGNDDVDCDALPVVAELVTFSSCGGGLAPIGRVRVPALDGVPTADLFAARSIAHGNFVTFFVGDIAVLVDITDTFAPAVVTSTVIQVPGVDRTHLSAGFDAGVWVIAKTTASLGTASASFFDVDPDGGLQPHGSLVLANGPPGRIVRSRVLGVRSPRAWFSVWDPTETPERGHSIIGVDLVGEPTIREDFALASEAVDLVVSDDKLVVGRVDGISVISPPCTPQ